MSPPIFDTEQHRMDCEMAAARIERVRDQLDVAINVSNEDCRAILLRADKMLKRLKSDLGFPLAGLAASDGTPAIEAFEHGFTCKKAPHSYGQGGYLHGPEDDTPYDVDGVKYCGRCHWALAARAWR